jgi:hypothetical protein
VSWDRPTKKWQANIRIDRKSYYLGLFSCEEEAARVFDQRAAPLGRPVNFPGPGQAQAAKRGAHGIVSQYMGVSWHMQLNKWQTHICIDGKDVHLIVHKIEEEAARAYDERAGPLGMPVNFPKENGQKQALKKGLSKYEGVQWNFDKQSWEAVNVQHGKRLPLGCFESEEEAAGAVDDHFFDRGSPRRHFPEMGELRLASVEPTSKFVGVNRQSKSKRWYATINIKGKDTHLGYFGSEDQAARAYDEQAAALGRPVNFPQQGQKQAVKKGSSEYRGVAKSGNKWKSAINLGGKMKHLGTFGSEEAAAQKYDEAAAPLGRAVNFLF